MYLLRPPGGGAGVADEDVRHPGLLLSVINRGFGQARAKPERNQDHWPPIPRSGGFMCAGAVRGKCRCLGAVIVARQLSPDMSNQLLDLHRIGADPDGIRSSMTARNAGGTFS
jgi:hypothetical protein